MKDQITILKAANRIAHLLSRTQRIEEAIEGLMTEFLDLSQAEEGSIQLLRPSSQQSQRTLIRRGKTDNKLLENHLDDLMTGWVVRHRQPLLSNDIASVFNLGKMADRHAAAKSIMASPLWAKEEIIGVVNLACSDYRKQFSTEELQLVSALATECSEFMEQAQLREQLFAENQRLREELANKLQHGGIIGNSAAMKEVFGLLDRVIPTDGRVMLQGESGTGKEIVAKFIHNSGPRARRSFVAVDCGALPPNLLESELFGYVKGAFTGADKDRAGLFEEADGGTLFLDEIGNMSQEIQAKLLRVLQEEEVRPLGSNQARKVNVRVVVAASQNLQEKVEGGEFRADLFYRLNVVPIRLPALRERIEDIPALAAHFLSRCAAKHDRPMQTIAPAAIDLLENHSWPGNVRELENVIERAVILADDHAQQLDAIHLPNELGTAHKQSSSFDLPTAGDLDMLLSDYERQILLKVLTHHDWNQSAAANALNISERVIRYKIKRLDLRRP